jgi:hypothetical protein
VSESEGWSGEAERVRCIYRATMGRFVLRGYVYATTLHRRHVFTPTTLTCIVKLHHVHTCIVQYCPWFLPKKNIAPSSQH